MIDLQGSARMLGDFAFFEMMFERFQHSSTTRFQHGGPTGDAVDFG